MNRPKSSTVLAGALAVSWCQVVIILREVLLSASVEVSWVTWAVLCLGPAVAIGVVVGIASSRLDF